MITVGLAHEAQRDVYQWAQSSQLRLVHRAIDVRAREKIDTIFNRYARIAGRVE